MQITGIPEHPLPAGADRAQAPARGNAPGQHDPAGAKKVAREFEAMFVAMMLKSMRETIPADPLTGGGRAEETFRSLLDQEYAQAATQGEGIGLARHIEREIARSYGVAEPKREVAHED